MVGEYAHPTGSLRHRSLQHQIILRFSHLPDSTFSPSPSDKTFRSCTSHDEGIHRPTRQLLGRVVLQAKESSMKKLIICAAAAMLSAAVPVLARTSHTSASRLSTTSHLSTPATITAVKKTAVVHHTAVKHSRHHALHAHRIRHTSLHAKSHAKALSHTHAKTLSSTHPRSRSLSHRTTVR